MAPGRSRIRRWSSCPREPSRPSSTSSSSAAARAGTPPPCTAPRPGSTSPWSRRRRSAAPACTAAASRRRSSSRRRPSTGPWPARRSSASRSSQPVVEFAVSQARKQKVVDQLFKGLPGLMKQRKVDDRRRHRPARAGHTVRVTADGRSTRQLRGTHDRPGVRVGAADHSRLRRRRPARADLRRGARRSRRFPASVVVIGGGAIGCEFASMLADLGSQVTLLEALPKILPGCDKDVADVVVRSFKAGHRRPDRRGRQRAHPGGRRHRPSHFGDGERVDVERSSSRSAAGRSPTASLAEGTGVEVDERGFVVVDEWMRTGAPTACSPSATSSTPRSSPTSASPRRCSSSSQILGEPVVPVDYPRSPGASTATPRWPSPG